MRQQPINPSRPPRISYDKPRHRWSGYGVKAAVVKHKAVPRFIRKRISLNGAEHAVTAKVVGSAADNKYIVHFEVNGVKYTSEWAE